MRISFGPGEDDEFEQARDQFIAVVRRWAGDRDRNADDFALSAALDHKHGVDGQLARWRTEDIATTLLDWFPRKVTLPESSWADVPATLHTLLEFLAERQLLVEDSASLEQLHATIDEHAQAYFAAMADERSYDIGKFWATRMLEHGVDLDDRAAVDRFVSAAQQGEIAVDEDVLSEIMGRQFDIGVDEPSQVSSAEPPDFPPVAMPTDTEVHQAAEASALLAWLRSLVDWVGDGRALTTTGQLKLADARELAQRLDVDTDLVDTVRTSADLPTISLLVSWAKEARLVRTVKQRLVPVKKSAPLLTKPVELWQRAFDVVEQLDDTLCFSPSSGWDVPSVLRMEFDQIVPMLWISLYQGAGEPLPMELLQGLVRETMVDRFEAYGPEFVGQPQQRLWRRDVAALVSAVESLGAVTTFAATEQAERDKIAELLGQQDPDVTLVEPTPIGLWAVNRMLRGYEVTAPVVGDLVAESLGTVCSQLEASSAEIAEAELREWVTARDHAAAAAELARYVGHCDDPLHRFIALIGLGQTGPAGVAEAESIRAAGGVAGAAVTLWLAEHELIDQSSVTELEAVLGLIEHFAVQQRQGLLIDAVQEQSGANQVTLVQRLGEVDHPQRMVILDTLAADHPEPKVARAARKARLRIQS